MTVVSLTDFNGRPARLPAGQIVRLRPALPSLDEYPGCTLIDCGPDALFASGNLQAVAGLFASYVRLAGLHALDGTQIFVNADAIAAVIADDRYPGNSIAIVKPEFEHPNIPARNRFGVLEDIPTAEAALGAAAT